ncbi:hypothetical protein I4F81_007847 [Pyropia yezoensis]|uniref:Uncharacterized protein n=1 Tax=Pyropia yezoensis TaxID=2788 RepID=A0ACC3C5W1_PYRYE|nr:hypothetical protein I4F81_007847 [Neopyropia yezoensis]
MDRVGRPETVNQDGDAQRLVVREVFEVVVANDDPDRGADAVVCPRLGASDVGGGEAVGDVGEVGGVGRDGVDE